uniref:SDE2/SF3A3 SAP domain-containing protein n=1 Tax=Brassica oleracea var. oleracea TaxID=109376 RepID=A0A0D3DQK4_BRAOL
MASSRFEDSNYAKKLFRLSSLFYGARRRLSFFLVRVDNDSRGGIQLLDYRMSDLIDTVDNHEGPVCSHSIAFLLLKRSLNARYVETVSTWVEGLLRDISKKNVGPEKLKEALGALGLKVGGTLQQRAERLFLTKASQLHKNLFRVRVELTIIVATRISPKFVGGQNHLSTISVYGQKLKETDIAIGSGEIPVNPTPLLNETTTAAQTTLMKA